MDCKAELLKNLKLPKVCCAYGLMFKHMILPLSLSLSQPDGEDVGVEGMTVLRGIIEEKGRGLSTWIRFRELSLHYLLEGVEAYYKDEVMVSWNKSRRRV